MIPFISRSEIDNKKTVCNLLYLFVFLKVESDDKKEM